MSRINIIVPVYNVEKYLDEFFESVINQTFQDFKLFVVNDYSTDRSKEIILSWQERFGSKLLYFENDSNLQAGWTRNRGLEKSEECDSEYTTFLDADDWIESDFLETMYSTAVKVDADMVICGIERFEDVTRKRVCIEAVNGPQKPVTDLRCFEEFSYINPAPYNKLYRSSNIKGRRFLSMKRSEDTCYFFDILPMMSSVVYTNRVSYHYRLRGTSLTGAFDFTVCQSMFDGFKKMYQIFEKKEYAPYKEMFETQVFIRTACGGACRASFSDMKNMIRYVEETYHYLNENISGWRKNKYLCFMKHKSQNWKQLALKCCAVMYKLHIFGIAVWIYYFMLKTLRKDIRM